MEGCPMNKAAMKHILNACSPPSADRQALFAAWREARDAAERRMLAPPRKITFERRQFQPYLDKLGGEKELERLFLEFLRERVV